MTNFLKGNTPATIYTQLLSVGGSADHAGLTTTLKNIFTDDGAGGSNTSSFKLSTTALRLESTNQLRFRDDAIYISSSGDSILNLVSDGEIDLASASIDLNSTTSLTIDNTNTSNGVVINAATSGSPISIGHSTSETTINDNLTVTGTTAHTGVVTLASGVKMQFVDGNEFVSGDGTNLTLGSSADINLTASTDINIPANVGLTFGDDGEKIEGNGTNLTVSSSGALLLTGSAASTFNTTGGGISIDAEAGAVTVDGHTGVNIAGTNGSEVDITTTGAVDVNSGAFTLDGTTLSIDGTDDSNVTVTGSAKDLTLSVVGGGTQTLSLSSAGTGANAIDVLASAGGIDIRATGAASGEDIDITTTGSSVNITSTENAQDAIVLSASAGGIDITSGGGAGEDIDITTSSSINLTSTENAANAIYIRANGGVSEKIKIHSDQGTDARSITLLSDVGGITLDGDTDHGVRINVNVSGAPVVIGHTTSETTVSDNLTVTGDLSVGGAIAYSALSVSHPTATVLTLDNQEHSNADNARDVTLKFTGEKGDGSSVDDMAQILVAHDGSSADQKGYIDFKTNAGSEGTSPSSALKLSADNTATFSGAIAAGTNAITGGILNIDNITLNANLISTTDTNGDLGISPNGTGGIMILNTNAPGDYSVSIGQASNADGDNAFAIGDAARASGNKSVSIGDASTASATNSVAIGDTNTASGANTVVLGSTSQATNSYSMAFGRNAKSDRKSELSFSGGMFAAVGDSRCVTMHKIDSFAMTSSMQSINGSATGGGIPFDSDSVACGTVRIVGSKAGAAKTIGFIIEFLVENDGGTEAIIQQTVRSYDSEDTSFNAQVAIVSSLLYAQVLDDADTDTMRWSTYWTFVQHTF